MSEINTHNLVIGFGKHNGERWTRVPLSYLRWLVNQPHEGNPDFMKNKEIAQAEIDRRGVTLGTEVEISDHAIDRASLRIRKIWHNDREAEEGIFSWLKRVATEALATAEGKPERVIHKDVIFVFKQGNVFPILKTVMPKSSARYRKMRKRYKNFSQEDA